MKAAGLRTLGDSADGDTDAPRTAVFRPIDRHFNDSQTRSDLARAWTDSGICWRAATVLTGLVALAATRAAAVPLASGLAVAVIVSAALVDVHQRRLPNRIVLAGALVFTVAMIAAIAQGHDARPASIIGGAAVMAGPLLLLHLVSPASMGLGDVKAAAVLGAAVGAVDWQLAVSALALAAGATATVGVLRRVRHLAFGPGLVLAAAVTLIAHPLLLPDTMP